MFSNYLKTAWRNIMRNKVSSFINIAGLTIGIACALLIVMFIQNELRYDKFHKDAGRIYQVILNGNFNDEEFWAGNIAPPIGAALANNFPEIESFTRLYKPRDVVVRHESNSSIVKSFTEKNVLAVDSNFLQVFGFKILEGDPATALMKPGSIVLTQDMAMKYFGIEKAIGKTLLAGQNRTPLIVTAVSGNVPAQSSIQFDFLTPMADYPVVKRMSWSWIWRQMVCYVKLKENVRDDEAGIKALEAKFPAMVKVEAATGFARIGKPFDEFLKSGGKWDLHLHPLTAIHLHSSEINMPWLSHISNIMYVYVFGCIAVFIIILACVNFMNLSTARAAKRAKEVGVRKVTGSTNAQLVRQFLAEAFVYSFISTALAVLFAALLAKPFSTITGESIDPGIAFNVGNWLMIAGLIIVVALLAGSYPAFYLTSFKPVTVLKGDNIFKSGKSALFIRNGLVVFQFAISTIMIIGTLIVFRQLNFFRDTNMGFSRENVVVITSTNRLGESEESFRQTISQMQGVSSASITTSMPSGFLFGDGYEPEPEGNAATAQEVGLASYMADDEFIPTLQIKVLKGRNFSKDFDDSLSVILNEEAVKQIGWKDPIGKWLQYPGGNNERFKVIAVIKNFNVQSLHTPIQPFALFHSSSKTYDLGATHILARIKPGDVGNTLNQLEAKWKSFASGEPFDYNFLDAAFDAQYRSEQRFGSIFSIFASLSIFIACLGLFGLCAYIAERRTKEIGVRKVLGASVPNLVGLLSKDFLKLTLIAAIIAFPIAWWAMEKWLEDFAYRIKISWDVFLVAGLCTLAVALFTVSFQAIKAAIANPVKSLRTE
ncbi:MAG: ABC transporter permease [Chitinophagaceae bacterium]